MIQYLCCNNKSRAPRQFPHTLTTQHPTPRAGNQKARTRGKPTLTFPKLARIEVRTRETERARGAMRRFEGSVEPGPFFDCGRETMMGDRQGGDGEER